MPTSLSLAPSPEIVKDALSQMITGAVAEIAAAAAEERSARALELAVWERGVPILRELLAFAFATRCAKVTEQSIAQLGVPPRHVRLRTDAAYGSMKVATTVGEVEFSSCAYRDTSGPAPVTRTPARDAVFPLYRQCRSSELLLELESRLAALHPYRKAEGLLAYFTRDAVQNEDTTIQRHAIRVGHLIEQRWLYKERGTVAEILRDRATCDRQTGRPVLYWSCDAHALRRFVDESWTPQWKMMNGLRVWCVDRRTNAIIHIGGEFTSGDAHYMTQRMKQLLDADILPANGDFGGGLVAQYVFVADGMPWLQQYLVPLLPGVVTITDAYHLIEYLAVVAKDRRRPGSLSAKCWLKEVTDKLFGPAPASRLSHARKGHRKRRRQQVEPSSPPKTRLRHSGRMLLKLLAPFPDDCEGLSQLRRYVEENLDRMDYLRYRARGFQIGSGAMESFHRTGSQDRLKRPGATWLPETLEAMFRLRMLELAGRWKEWWTQIRFADVQDSFGPTTYRTRTGPEAAKKKKRARSTA